MTTFAFLSFALTNQIYKFMNHKTKSGILVATSVAMAVGCTQQQGTDKSSAIGPEGGIDRTVLPIKWVIKSGGTLKTRIALFTHTRIVLIDYSDNKHFQGRPLPHLYAICYCHLLHAPNSLIIPKWCKKHFPRQVPTKTIYAMLRTRYKNI